MIAHPFANDRFPQTTRIVGFVSLIFFGGGTAFLLFAPIGRVRIVRLTESGLLIGGHKRWITWGEITDIRFVYQDVPGFFGANPRQIEWIGLFLQDTSAYHASWGPIGRWLTSISERKLGTPILINCDLLPIDPDIFIAWLNEYRAAYP
jgi:hypothetical protein